MKKTKYKKITKETLERSFFGYRLFSHSLQDSFTIIKEFNGLSEDQRKCIVKDYSKMEVALRKRSSTLDEDANLTCTMVNFNIVASKYNIDPATVCMCVSPPCKLNEKILIGK